MGSAGVPCLGLIPAYHCLTHGPGHFYDELGETNWNSAVAKFICAATDQLCCDKYFSGVKCHPTGFLPDQAESFVIYRSDYLWMPCMEIKVALNFGNAVCKARHEAALREFCKQGLIHRTWELLEGKNKLALMSFDLIFKVGNFDTFGSILH